VDEIEIVFTHLQHLLYWGDVKVKEGKEEEKGKKQEEEEQNRGKSQGSSMNYRRRVHLLLSH